MDPNIELLLSNINSMVFELIKNYNVSQRFINKSISDYIKNKSEEKKPVLYNNCYGGYNLSQSFINFINENNKDDNNKYEESDEYGKKYRIKGAELIIPYGNTIISKYPLLFELVNIYNYSNLHKLVTNILNYNMYNNSLKKINNKRIELKEYLSCKYSNYKKENGEEYEKFIKRDINIYNLNSYTLWWNYKKSELESFYNSNYFDENIKSYTNKINDIINSDFWISIPKNVIDEINKFNELNIKKKDKELSFIYAIEKHGILDNLDIWDYQSHLNENNMKLLVYLKNNNSEIYEYFKNQKKDKEINIEYIGLLCASGPYCRLDIAYVNAYNDWNIEYNDGLEYIKEL